MRCNLVFVDRCAYLPASLTASLPPPSQLHPDPAVVAAEKKKAEAVRMVENC